MKNFKKTPVVYIAIALLVVAFILFLFARDAEAQRANYDVHGSMTEYACATYGCLFDHKTLAYYSRTGPVFRHDLGISDHPLPDQPEEYDQGRGGRMFVTVLWPMVNDSYRYNPARRAEWDRLAGCESTWNWDINNGNGYHGGLQFHPNTWRAYGGGEFAAYAYQATPEQQITVAERVLWAGYGHNGPQGRGAWPGCRNKGKGAPFPP